MELSSKLKNRNSSCQIVLLFIGACGFVYGGNMQVRLILLGIVSNLHDSVFIGFQVSGCKSEYTAWNLKLYKSYKTYRTYLIYQTISLKPYALHPAPITYFLTPDTWNQENCFV